MGDDRPSVYREGDVWVIRASALGGCMKALIAAGRGVEAAATPDWMQEKFDQGHAAERPIAEWHYKAYNCAPMPREATRWVDGDLKMVDGQWEFNYRVNDNITVRGHLDDIVVSTSPGDMCGVEYKAVGPDLFRDIKSKGAEAKPNYAWQLSIYMAATKRPWRFLAVLKDDDGKPILDNDPAHSWSRFYTEAPIEESAITTRAVTVIDWVEHREYDEYPPCDVKQYPCPYYLLEDDDDDIPTLTVDESNTLKWIREAIDRAALMELDAKALKAAAQQDLKTLLADRKTVLSTDGTKVTWVRTEHPEKLVTPKPYTKKAYVTEYPKITPPKET